MKNIKKLLFFSGNRDVRDMETMSLKNTEIRINC